jgi:hypothetical protein
MGVFGRWSLVPICCPHDRTTQHTITPSTTGVWWNHPQHTITPGTTGVQHHERPYHACTTGILHDGDRHHGLSPRRRVVHEKRSADHVAQRPNGLRFSCRQGALHQMTSKKQRSRAPKAVSCKRLFGGNRGWIIL